MDCVPDNTGNVTFYKPLNLLKDQLPYVQCNNEFYGSLRCHSFTEILAMATA